MRGGLKRVFKRHIMRGKFKRGRNAGGRMGCNCKVENGNMKQELKMKGR